MLALVQLGSALGYLLVSFYPGDYGVGYLGPLDFFTFQIVAGVSLLLIALGVSGNPIPFAAYITVYLLVISPLFLYLLLAFGVGVAREERNLTEYWGLLAVSMVGVISTWIFFDKFIVNKRMLPWLPKLPSKWWG